MNSNIHEEIITRLDNLFDSNNIINEKFKLGELAITGAMEQFTEMLKKHSVILEKITTKSEFRYGKSINYLYVFVEDNKRFIWNILFTPVYNESDRNCHYCIDFYLKDIKSYTSFSLFTEERVLDHIMFLIKREDYIKNLFTYDGDYIPQQLLE